MKEAAATDPMFKTALSEYTKAGLLGGKDKESMKQRMIKGQDLWISGLLNRKQMLLLVM